VSPSFDPFDAAFLQDPYPTYARLRAAPVLRLRFGPRVVLRLLWRFVVARRRAGESGWLRTLATLWRERKVWRARRESRRRMRSRLYVVSRYRDVAHVLRSAELFSSEAMGGAEPRAMSAEGDIAPTSGSLIGLDPPEHGRHRAIVSRGFTPRRIAALARRARRPPPT
jgi:cytochrome P450